MSLSDFSSFFTLVSVVFLFFLYVFFRVRVIVVWCAALLGSGEFMQVYEIYFLAPCFLFPASV